MVSTCAPRTTRRTPNPGRNGTTSRWSRKGRPWYGSSAFGEPIRLEAPPERMTAASMCSLSALVHGVNCSRARCVFQFLVCPRFRIPSYSDEFRHNADGNLLWRERANFQPHRRVDAFEFFRFAALVLKRLINGQHFALASNHPDIARFRPYCPGQHTHVFLVAARHDD